MFDYKKLKNIDRDDLLSYLGLQSRRSTVEDVIPAIGIFAVGLLVGAGIGMLFAPKPGDELRGDLLQKLQSSNLGQVGQQLVSSVGVQAPEKRNI